MGAVLAYGEKAHCSWNAEEDVRQPAGYPGKKKVNLTQGCAQRKHDIVEKEHKES